MSKCLYKFNEGARQLRCQGFESFLHTLIKQGWVQRNSFVPMEPVNREFISPHLETQSPDPSFGTDNSPYQPRKRPRPAQSCLSCRKKKLKCDRLAPCRQCIMRAAQCAYDHEEVIRSSARATEESSLESDERRRKVPIPPLPREVRNPAGVPVVAPFTPSRGVTRVQG